jgi:hypothetical protein
MLKHVRFTFLSPTKSCWRDEILSLCDSTGGCNGVGGSVKRAMIARMAGSQQATLADGEATERLRLVYLVPFLWSLPLWGKGDRRGIASGFAPSLLR